MPFIFFSLNTHILPFTEAEIAAGESIQSAGWKPVFLLASSCQCRRCDDPANGTVNTVAQCAKCTAELMILKTTLRGWDVMRLQDFSEPGDAVAVNAGLLDLDMADPRNFYFRGEAVGSACLHDVALKFKVDDIDLSLRPEVASDYKESVREAMFALLCMDRVHHTLRPVGLATYNSNYSINRVVSLDCERRGIPHYSMHGGASLRYVWDALMLTKGDIEGYRAACVHNWEKDMKDRVLDAAEVGRVADHFKELFVGRKAHAYSAAAGSSDPHRLFPEGASEASTQRTLLLCLSSSDERFAVEQSGIRPVFSPHDFVFPEQYDLLGFIIDKVSREEGLRLIVRVHPRDFPNKRETRTSDNGRRLKKLLKNLPDNVVVNWPEQKISYYDLLQHVDLVVTAWSTVLLEASLFGCPIVLPFNPTRYYDACADDLCHDRESYWAAILQKSACPWTLARAVRTFRWYWMVQFGGAVSLASPDRRSCTPQEWWLRGFDWASKTIFMGRPPYSVPSAFSGEFKRLLRRRINPRGAAVIAATLKGEFDPMSDFRELHRRQGFRDGYRNGEDAESEERVAVYHQLSEFSRMLKLQAGAYPRSKFLAMLGRESHALTNTPLQPKRALQVTSSKTTAPCGFAG